ncbi:hypothetical protein TNCV_1105981 [Trichonephila clavipes]|nr:hypothetical protein TNCV_1105981 [Trichonephila clavipes]
MPRCRGSVEFDIRFLVEPGLKSVMDSNLDFKPMSDRNSRPWPQTCHDLPNFLILCSGNRVVKVSDRGWPCHEFEPSTTKDRPCMGALHVKSVESSNVLPLVW